jgi:hypothetical protein
VKRYSLLPFGNAIFDFEIECSIERRANTLAVSFELAGDLAALDIPQPVPTPARQDRLWEDTCFEFFIAPQNLPQYWEFNLAPSGNWNVYRLDSYRQGLRVESSVTMLPFAIRRQPDLLSLDLEVELDEFIQSSEPVQAAISAIVKQHALHSTVTYWALKHCGEQPDFHLRESFIVAL